MKTYKPFSLIMRDHLTATDLLSVHVMKMFLSQKIQNIKRDGEMKINSENVWIYK